MAESSARERLAAFLCVFTLGASAAAPGPAAAQGPGFVVLGQGSFPALATNWQGIALQPNFVSLDLYNAEGALFQSYTPQFASPPPKRGLNALGYRPLGLPTTAALVAGVAGTKVKTVKVFFAGLPTVKIAPTPVPAWGFPGRFFAAGAVVPDVYATATQVVTRVKALDRKGRRVATVDNIFTNPF